MGKRFYAACCRCHGPNNGGHSYCARCKRAYYADQMTDPAKKERRLESQRRYRRKESRAVKLERNRRYNWRRYGLTVAAYESLFESQNGICPICGRSLEEVSAIIHRAPHVDHCHATGAVRGILCHHCNLAVGLIRNDPLIARRMAVYLERTQPMINASQPVLHL